MDGQTFRAIMRVCASARLAHSQRHVAEQLLVLLYASESVNTLSTHYGQDSYCLFNEISKKRRFFRRLRAACGRDLY